MGRVQRPAYRRQSPALALSVAVFCGRVPRCGARSAPRIPKAVARKKSPRAPHAAATKPPRCAPKVAANSPSAARARARSAHRPRSGPEMAAAAGQQAPDGRKGMAGACVFHVEHRAHLEAAAGRRLRVSRGTPRPPGSRRRPAPRAPYTTPKHNPHIYASRHRINVRVCVCARWTTLPECWPGAGAGTSWTACASGAQRVTPQPQPRDDDDASARSVDGPACGRCGRAPWTSWSERRAPCAAQLRAWRALERRHALRTAAPCLCNESVAPDTPPPSERPACAAPAASPGLRPCAPHHSVGLALPRFACWAALPLQCLSARAALGATHIRAAFCIPGGPAPRASGLLSPSAASGPRQHPPYIRAAFCIPGGPAPRASGLLSPSAASGPRQHPPSLPCAGVVQRLGRSTFRPAAPLRARQTCAAGVRHAAPPWRVSLFAGFDAARSRRPPCRAGARQLGPAPAIQRQAFGASRLTLRPARNPPPRCFRRATPRPAAVGR